MKICDLFLLVDKNKDGKLDNEFNESKRYQQTLNDRNSLPTEKAKWAQLTETDAVVLLKSMMTKSSSAVSPTISFDGLEHALKLACFEGVLSSNQREQVYVNQLFRQMYVDCSGTIR
ncbi:hypothetical protein Pelo_6523 [Pelomyxa schiedti]|nr:hypothetical protein Pelo_6523 [Pelomyxa schiedti]